MQQTWTAAEWSLGIDRQHLCMITVLHVPGQYYPSSCKHDQVLRCSILLLQGLKPLMRHGDQYVQQTDLRKTSMLDILVTGVQEIANTAWKSKLMRGLAEDQLGVEQVRMLHITKQTHYASPRELLQGQNPSRLHERQTLCTPGSGMT